MSSSLRVLSTHELVLVICQYATTFAIFSLSQTSTVIRRAAREALKVRVDDHVRDFFDDPPVLRTLLETWDSNISGDVPLEVLLEHEDYVPLDCPTLTINVPFGLGHFIREAFFQKGYKRMKYHTEKQLDDDSPILVDTNALNRDRSRAAAGSSSTTKLILQRPHCPPRRVNISESHSRDCLEPNLYPTNSAHCNIITAHGFCIPFPQLTTLKQYAKPKRSPMDPEDEITMELSGLTRVAMKVHGVRHFFDKKCMLMAFGEDYEWAKDELLAEEGYIVW